MKRASFAVLAILVFLTGCTGDFHDDTYTVGILCGLDFILPITDSFKAEMTDLGYIEGQNIEYDFHSTNFEPEREQEIMQRFIDEDVDLILTFPTEVSMEAKHLARGTGIPVLFAFANIEDTGLVESIPQPGDGITGVRYPGPDLAIKRFEVMMELAPDTKRIWVPFQRGYPIVHSQIDAIAPAAEAAGVEILQFPADDAAELQAELNRRSALDNIGFDAIMFVAEPLTVTADAYLVLTEFAHKEKLPIGGAIMPVEGPSAIYNVNAHLDDVGSKAAMLADKILRGASAGTIPVVSADQFFEINPSAAEQLGVNISKSLLVRADGFVS